MKKRKFTDSQIMAGLKRAEAGIPVPKIYRELGIRSATFYSSLWMDTRTVVRTASDSPDTDSTAILRVLGGVLKLSSQ